MFERELETVSDNGNYYFSEEGLCLRMFGGSRAPSLLLKYATDYVVHKEVARKLYIDEIRNFLFDQKNVVYPPLPFYIGSYKFTKVKSALEFVKELENFQFGEKTFHMNDSKDKISKYCASVGVNFEYTNYWDKDEEIYHKACNMATLSRRFKKKITIVGGKGSSSGTAEQQKQEEEAVKKMEEEARRLLQEEEQRLAEEAQWKNEEDEQR